VYTIDADLTPQEVERLRRELFTDSIIQESSATSRLARFRLIIEVGFRPGVTDNVGKRREGSKKCWGDIWHPRGGTRPGKFAHRSVDADEVER
jgi:hypothetical protein